MGTQGKIYYHYDAVGNKLAKYIENSNSSTNTTTEYIANLVYTNGQKSFFSTEEGRAIPIVAAGKTRWHYEYYLKDHLGNTRRTFGGSNLGGAADIVQTSSYYPFGTIMAQKNYNSGGNSCQLNKYLYNGKELQDDILGGVSLDWYDYGARMYDPSIGRWHTIDPLAEEYAYASPYNYVLNNPLKFVDPDGKKVKIKITEAEVHVSTWPLNKATGTPGKPNNKPDIGGAFSVWRGSGTDDYGSFIVKHAINFGIHDVEGQEAYGVDIGLSASYVVDKKSKGIEDFINSAPPTSAAIGPVEIIFGNGKLGLGIGLSAGGGASKVNTIIAEFLGFTSSDMNGVRGEPMSYSVNENGYLVFRSSTGDAEYSTTTGIKVVEKEPGQYYTPSYLENKKNQESNEDDEQ